jgi:hypothetical protein
MPSVTVPSHLSTSVYLSQPLPFISALHHLGTASFSAFHISYLVKPGEDI